MIIAIHQPQYLPWIGYFDKIDRSDVFVLLDNVQYKKNEAQNRNRIRTLLFQNLKTLKPCTSNHPSLLLFLSIQC
ncbi:MAG TPA: WbqC family protein [Candidatus Brocadiaceae bacterium]